MEQFLVSNMLLYDLIGVQMMWLYHYLEGLPNLLVLAGFLEYVFAGRKYRVKHVAHVPSPFVRYRVTWLILCVWMWVIEIEVFKSVKFYVNAK